MQGVLNLIECSNISQSYIFQGIGYQPFNFVLFFWLITKINLMKKCPNYDLRLRYSCDIAKFVKMQEVELLFLGFNLVLLGLIQCILQHFCYTLLFLFKVKHFNDWRIHHFDRDRLTLHTIIQIKYSIFICNM